VKGNIRRMNYDNQRVILECKSGSIWEYHRNGGLTECGIDIKYIMICYD